MFIYHVPCAIPYTRYSIPSTLYHIRILMFTESFGKINSSEQFFNSHILTSRCVLPASQAKCIDLDSDAEGLQTLTCS